MRSFQVCDECGEVQGAYIAESGDYGPDIALREGWTNDGVNRWHCPDCPPLAPRGIVAAVAMSQTSRPHTPS